MSFSLNPIKWFGESKSIPTNKEVTPTETKYYGPGISNGDSFVGFLLDNGNYDLAFIALVNYYKSCGPLSDGIDKVAQEVQTIQPRVWDRSQEKFIDHPVDNLINHPNSDMSREDFLFSICATYLLTGNVFPYVTLGISRNPLELLSYNIQDLTLEADTRDGFIGTIQSNTTYQQEFYIREEGTHRFRYKNKDNSKEVWPIRRFNPRKDSSNLFGLSPINSIFLEIEQYIASSKHNLSLLKRGARPGGVFSTISDMPLSDEQFMRMQDQINRYYMGENNAGRPLLMENTKYEESIVNNRDMDYSSMRKNIQAMIYNRLNIPLPSISGENMTLANMDVAKLNLYDNAVIPVTRVLLGQLGRFLFPLYDEQSRADQLELTFDEGSIAALQTRRNDVVKIRKDIGVNSDNELRRELGDQPIEGGDVIYKANNLVPVGYDGSDPSDNPLSVDEQPADEPVLIDQTDGTKTVHFKNFVKKMKETTSLTDKEILERAKRYGIK